MLRTSPFLLLIFLSIICLFSACKEDITPSVPSPKSPNLKASINIIQDTFQGIPIVLVGSESYNFIVSFESELNGESLFFQLPPSNKSLPTIMLDEEGNEWDIFGRAIKGPRQGQQLVSMSSTMGYWFSFSPFFEKVDIYNAPTVEEHSLPKSERSDWLIPFSNILDGGVGFDGIPALVNPEFEAYDFRANPENTFFVDDNNLVVGIRFEEELKLYPHPILDWHEIVNDRIGDQSFALVYCPLTGTTTVWDRDLNGEEVEFGVSGYLHNSNIIPFDRNTESFWSQLYGLSVNGTRQGQKAINLPHLETTWSTWKIIADAPQLVSENTGYSRDYRRYPYGDYRTSNNLLFPIAYEDNRIPLKERVHAIMGDRYVKVYRFEDFR
ncbi:MAG: DUF3179 domain-containing (seleno)protein [Bacteroidota bacterium]